MNSRFSKAQILWARNFWRNLTLADLGFFWRHYTTGEGAGMYGNVKSDTSFLDYLYLSACESQMEQALDI